MSSSILDRTCRLTAAGPVAFNNDVRLSMNSREAISVRKWEPPFLTQVSVSCTSSQYNGGTTRCNTLSPMTYVESTQLSVGILVANTLLERAHGLLRLDCLGPDDIRDLEVESNVLQTAAGGLLNLLVQSRVGPGGPPSHHLSMPAKAQTIVFVVRDVRRGNSSCCWSLNNNGRKLRGSYPVHSPRRKLRVFNERPAVGD
ncbi:hypothetical protein GE09DRAFT_737619 [Coniochaeta sp. 2T2.1]|nr:hypothetical protein GE09DRAFT_737619 [Coniochaeta sp. 2T2.1]